MKNKKHKIILVTGGSRSGKSRFSLELAEKYSKKSFIATAVSLDDEMAKRIQRHQSERDASFATIEEPIDLNKAIGRIPKNSDVALIDCLSVWMGNLMHKNGIQDEPYAEVDSFINSLQSPPCDIIIVTNEIGMGIIPADAMTRSYRDHAGWLNQDVAKIADEVYLVVSGIAIEIKHLRCNG